MQESEDHPLYTIGTAAELIGVSVHTLRMYEREGLIIPFKKESRQRRYSRNDIERLRCVRVAITRDKISLAGIKRLFSLIPCWSIVHCSEADRARCSAIEGAAHPCWTYNHLHNVCSGGECRTCPVYTGFSACSPIKEHLKSITLGEA
jgi:MerR family transcriptional regulator, heat shock protein HspR